ncbi:MAG: hemolysin III family protein [Aureliella sp.]
MSQATSAPPAAEPVAQTQYHANELINALTHGAGLVLSIVGCIVLVASAIASGEVWRVAGCSIFSAAMISVYAMSTLSHSAFKPELVRLFERLDQGSIYLLIVGTYTPFSLVYLRTDGFWLLFGVMWTLALSGCVCKVFFPDRLNGTAVWTYVCLGWLPALAAQSLLERVPAGALWGVLIGGLCYTLGTVFLVLDNQRFRFHAIWHIFVIAGSTCHFLTVLFFAA